MRIMKWTTDKDGYEEFIIEKELYHLATKILECEDDKFLEWMRFSAPYPIQHLIMIFLFQMIIINFLFKFSIRQNG